ncbi:hypothetical protein N7540_001771 [Penicillium herquei]|nr:hypothetical protein N7540_001771 [Penicillium herquei]
MIAVLILRPKDTIIILSENRMDLHQAHPIMFIPLPAPCMGFHNPKKRLFKATKVFPEISSRKQDGYMDRLYQLSW